VREIARREQVAPRYVRELLPLGFVSPRIVEAIAQGRHPAELTVIHLTRRIELPLWWRAQQRTIGIVRPSADGGA
jgi:site-specific DNA recombinase